MNKWEELFNDYPSFKDLDRRTVTHVLSSAESEGKICFVPDEKQINNVITKSMNHETMAYLNSNRDYLVKEILRLLRGTHG